jgi:hypothetical protein
MRPDTITSTKRYSAWAHRESILAGLIMMQERLFIDQMTKRIHLSFAISPLPDSKQKAINSKVSFKEAITSHNNQPKNQRFNKRLT